jgi:hypothetical protein
MKYILASLVLLSFYAYGQHLKVNATQFTQLAPARVQVVTHPSGRALVVSQVQGGSTLEAQDLQRTITANELQ